MERVDNDPAALVRKAQRTQHDLFAGGGRLGPGDLIGIGIHQRREFRDHAGAIDWGRRRGIEHPRREMPIDEDQRAIGTPFVG